MMDHAVMASMMRVAMYPFEVHNYCLCISQGRFFIQDSQAPCQTGRTCRQGLYFLRKEIATEVTETTEKGKAKQAYSLRKASLLFINLFPSVRSVTSVAIFFGNESPAI